MTLSMTRAEREAFLADVHVGVLSIPEPGRGPLSAPIWYGYEPSGEIWVVTGRDSRKGGLLAPGVRVGFVVQTEQAPYRYVSVEGPVSGCSRTVTSPRGWATPTSPRPPRGRAQRPGAHPPRTLALGGLPEGVRLS